MDKVHDFLCILAGVELGKEVRIGKKLDQRLKRTQMRVVVLRAEREQVLHRIVVLAAKLDRILERHNTHGRLESSALGTGVRERHVLRDHDVRAKFVDTLDDVVNVALRHLAIGNQRSRCLADGILPVARLNIELN